MTELYLHNSGPRGDVVFSRAVYRAVAASGRFDLAIGVCRDDVELVADLAGPRCRILASDYGNTPSGSVIDLEHLAPPAASSLAVWLGGVEEFASYQWRDIVASFHDAMQERGIDFMLPGGPDDGPDDVPMLDFLGDVPLPPLRRRSIWLDNVRTAHEPCHFVFDYSRLAGALPGIDLLCTAPVPIVRDNLVDVSSLGPVQRSKLSERCEALVGQTMDPFNLTLTEKNRFKPKALCGYDARVCAPAWDYPGNPLELLGTMDELVDFLIANVQEAVR